MLTTTFARLKKAGACAEGYKKLVKYLGDVRKYGEETPITLLQIYESNGLTDAVWAFRAVIETEEALAVAQAMALGAFFELIGDGVLPERLKRELAALPGQPYHLNAGRLQGEVQRCIRLLQDDLKPYPRLNDYPVPVRKAIHDLSYLLGERQWMVCETVLVYWQSC